VAEYRCISTDLLTGTRIAELPLTGLSYSKTLSGAGEASGTLYLPPPNSVANRTLAADWNNAVDECRRQLVIERDGVVVWSGIVWASPYNDADQTRSIKCGEDWSYFRKLTMPYTYTFSSTPQMDIADSIMYLAQFYSPANVGVSVVKNLASGYTDIERDRTYSRNELKTVADAIEQLAGVSNGFEFGIDSSWSSTGTLQKVLNLHYPRRGRSYNETGHVFELGRNIVSFTWPSDGTRTHNRVWAQGQGEGDSQLSGIAVDSSQIQPLSSGGPGYPLLEEVYSAGDISMQSTINAIAAARVQYTSTPVTLPELTVRADMDPGLGSYICGDACRVIITPNTSPRFPDGLDTYYRIVGYSVAVDDMGQENVKLVLGPEFIYA
jgi:hypothetical protein